MSTSWIGQKVELLNSDGDAVAFGTIIGDDEDTGIIRLDSGRVFPYSEEGNTWQFRL